MRTFILFILAASTNLYAHDLTKLPLGDGKISEYPKRGYVWTCNSKAMGFGGGSHKMGPWINNQDMTWNYNKKILVTGSNKWKNELIINRQEDKTAIKINGLPSHKTGDYPIRRDSEAFEYDRNPNVISRQNIELEIPKNPKEQEAQCVPNFVGVMLSGVVLLNALDEPKRDAPAHEIQDKCDGHPQKTGIYHYHNISRCLPDEQDKEGHSPILGFAIDGFGIYGKYSNGKKVSNQDLDDCHGHKHEIIWYGEKRNMYHYHGTDEYPYTVGCLKGNYDIQAIRNIMRPNNENNTGQKGNPINQRFKPNFR